MATPVGTRAIIAEALDYTLGTLVLDPVRRIAQRNRGFEPIVDEIYLKPTFMPARSDYVGVGTTSERFIGLYQVNVVGPDDKNPVIHDNVADAVAAHFKGLKITRNSKLIRIGVTTGDATGGTPYVSAEIIANGWRTIPVTIPWWCDD